MGESKKDALRVNFDRKLKLEFHGVKVTSDTGLLAYREIDDVFGFIFWDRFDTLLEKKLSGVAGLWYTILYGKSQFNHMEIRSWAPQEKIYRFG